MRLCSDWRNAKKIYVKQYVEIPDGRQTKYFYKTGPGIKRARKEGDNWSWSVTKRASQECDLHQPVALSYK